MQTSLTQSQVKHLFDYNPETGKLTRKKSGKTVGNLNHRGYFNIGINYKVYLVHRIIWLYVHGYFPENDIDHIDRNRLNNQISNLREVSKQCNARNSGLYINNFSAVTGVSLDKKQMCWRAHIRLNHKRYYLHSSIDYIEAAAHRLAAEQCLNWHNCNMQSSAQKCINNYITQQKLAQSD
jgi:hypothetical protein